MKNIFLLSLLFIGLNFYAKGQCDTSPINNTAWSLVYIDSSTPDGTGVEAIDGDPLTLWHTEWDAAQPDFPHEIQFDLGTNYPVSGIGILPRQNGALNGKVTDYEIHLSLDGTNWTMQNTGSFSYDNNNDLDIQQVYFGSIDARYVRFVGLAGYDNQFYMAIANIEMYQDLTCAPTGQNNQSITFEPIADMYTTDDPLDLAAMASSTLPVTYSIVSGPATIVNNTLTVTGTAGTVEVKAEQLGDVSYYPVSTNRTFEVIGLDVIYPTVTTKLTDAFPIEMPTLTAYPLYANAEIDESETLSITGVEFEVEGNTIPATYSGGYYLAWWTPSATGNYDVIVKATGSNGNVTSNTVNVDVINTVADRNIQAFDGDLVNFDGSGASRWFYGTYTLPQSIGAYDQIIANFAVTCPAIAGGCDDWDRLAYVEYKAPDGTWMELFRYITPYRVACDHSIDVTDYASLLHGNIEIRMFIDTWGTGGWDLHMDFDYKAGTPDYFYSQIQELWHGYYSFGNPGNLQPLDTVTVDYPTNTQKATFRLTTTGHGWGDNNTNNAAEFFNANHSFKINGTTTYTQSLWNDCNPNPDNCTGQQGSWTYNRAGWCPGTIAPPHTYDLTDKITSAPFDFSYVFLQSYQDLCHANNPNCVSGTTCPDCNDGYNPAYQIGAYMISFSNAPLLTSITGVEVEKEFGIDVFPNPSTGIFNMSMTEEKGDVVVTVNDVRGATLKTYFFKNKSELEGYLFNITSLAKGNYFIKVDTEHRSTVKSIVLH